MNTLNDFEFESIQFVDYVQPTFSSLFTLLKEARECDTKMSVLNGMSVIFDKMGEKLSNDAESLCHYLPMLWHESDDHNMLRCAILSALVSSSITKRVLLIQIQCFLPLSFTLIECHFVYVYSYRSSLPYQRFRHFCRHSSIQSLQ